MSEIDGRATAATRRRYTRIAAFYNWLEALAETRYRPWRMRFWQEVSRRLPKGGSLLELGVGTGKNIPYWPQGIQIKGVDLTPAMLRRAKAKAQELGVQAELVVGDAQALDMPDDSADGGAATFVFCSVPDPVLGLKELKRVIRPGGPVVLMEHVRSPISWLAKLMDLLNPIVVGIMGANINRDTVGNVRKAGLEIEGMEDLGMGGVFKLILAKVPGSG